MFLNTNLRRDLDPFSLRRVRRCLMRGRILVGFLILTLWRLMANLLERLLITASIRNR
ncbi:hypothetical protein CBM2594_A90005 [Cupriavidus taiwanensis]|uniref:Uncharacterized protein n=1 Tax=Cupriavidus taiwanensis TaxID=164546 RepID=A0A7Z7J9X0_9BURK|nr:hypothetical protein CBM2594_A90005 [Cupriavidus taiwanensis]